MATVTTPSTRVRTNYAQNAKGEWRVSEITVEITDHPDPVMETSRLYLQLRTQAERDVATRSSVRSQLSQPIETET